MDTRYFLHIPTIEIKAIAGLILIQLHIQKLSEHNQLRTSSISNNHTIKSLLKIRHVENSTPHHLSLEYMTSKQRLKISLHDLG